MTENPIFIVEKRLAEEAAERNFDAIATESPWLEDLVKLLDPIVAENASVRSRYRKFANLADRINGAIAPHSACSRGCNACCHIAVGISAHEADIIGQNIGVKPKAVQGSFSAPAVQDRHFGQPCSFLRDGECSIYEHRPLECRLHANIGHSPFFCSTDIAPKESMVPNINLTAFYVAYGAMFTNRRGMADIREYFPSGLDKDANK